MSILISRLNCCGINEIADIYENHPDIITNQIAKDYVEKGNQSAFYIFSDIGDKKIGNSLAKYIKKNKLGLITKSPSRINPNSGNSLKVWIWTLNKQNLRNYWNKHKYE